MKKIGRIQLLVGLLAALVYSGCMIDGDKARKHPEGQARISVKLEKTGALAKAGAIEMTNLSLTFVSFGEEVQEDIPLSGNSQQSVTQTFDLESGKTWVVTAKATDANSQIVYFGTSSFQVPANGSVNVSLILAAQFSMLNAHFHPIFSHVDRVSLLVDGNLVADQSSLTSLGSDTVTLEHDYISASPSGVDHFIRMEATGSVNGQNVLYRGDTVIRVISGEDASYDVVLRWMGATPPPTGEASMTVTLGSIATVTLNGRLEEGAYDWEYVGSRWLSSGQASIPVLALGPSGNPYVIYTNYDSSPSHPAIMTWDGSTWESIGSSSDFTGGANAPTAIAVNTEDVPYIAYGDGDGNLHVASWTGSAWISLDSAPIASSASDPTLGISADGTVYVCYASYGEVRVKRWTGTAWASVGATVGASSAWPQMRLGSDGLPYVAFSDGAHGNLVTVKRWTGTAWESVGSEGFSPVNTRISSFDLDENDVPYVAISNQVDYDVAILRWDGISWESLGGSTPSIGKAWYPAVAVNPDGVPYVAFADETQGNRAVAIKRWNGSTWQSVREATGSDGSTPGLTASFDFDQNGTGYVVFQDVDNGGRASLIRLSLQQ